MVFEDGRAGGEVVAAGDAGARVSARAESGRGATTEARARAESAGAAAASRPVSRTIAIIGATIAQPARRSSAAARGLEQRVDLRGQDEVVGVETLDLVTGEIKTIFTVPGDGWIYYSTVSPDGKQLVISYVPDSASNSARNQALYIMPMDSSAPPKLLVIPPTGSDQYIQAEWSPDGKYLYFVHNNYKTQPVGQIFPDYQIFRVTYPKGQPEQIVDKAFWPRISPDSSKMVYVSLDPNAGTSELFLANADGTNAHVIKTGDSQNQSIKDSPLFAPDGQSIIFSAPSPAQSYQPNWLDKLMGVQIAKAHSIPSDWWSVPITGGTPTRLTQLHSKNLFGRLAPDKKHLISFSAQGIFVMDLDGSNLTSLIPDSGGTTVDWLP